MILKLGTRRSLLAWSQSSWVARQIELLNPGTQVELVGIDTQGDKILDKPLSKIEGKEFFTAELDHALLEGRVDFTVHSMKDLSLDRPASFKLAAIPPRELQHDVILFHESVLEKLKKGQEILIGTSSPRRLTLLPSFLEKALPRTQPSATPRLKFLEIRGNVNTRLSRVHEPEGSERKLDGVVLAYAGLERLALDSHASIELRKLLKNTKTMVVPVRECPTAPAQGALAVETRRDHQLALSALEKLHDPQTEQGVQQERNILREWGGGCHQKLGANFVSHPEGGKLFIRGQKPSGEWVTEIRNLSSSSHSMTQFTRIEAGDLFDFSKRTLTQDEASQLQSAPICFIAHSRALEHLDPRWLSTLAQKRIWVSGMKSWEKLAKHGVWVEGSVEYKGFESFQIFRKKSLLDLTGTVAFLTHSESVIHEAGTILIPSYSHQFREIPQKIIHSSHLYWSSGLPFSTVWSMIGSPEEKAEFMKKTHASGAGKTASIIRNHGIEPVIIDADF